MLGGPLGALLGASLGHSIDSSFSRGARGQYFPGGQERTQAAFFTATFSVMGHIAKADGKVSRQEINLAETVMDEMRLNNLQRKAARKLFNRGKQSEFDIESVLNQFRMECHRRVTLLRIFMEIQVQAAFADGRLDPKENRILANIARQLGFRSADLNRIINMVRGTGTDAAPDGQTASDLNPYDVLGITPDTPLPEIKKTYRRLLNQHHPDKLVAKGLPEEMIKLANQRTREIRQAWKNIQTQHQTV